MKIIFIANSEKMGGGNKSLISITSPNNDLFLLSILSKLKISEILKGP